MIKPRLGYFDLTMIIVSLVIGIGIFRTPAIVAEQAGTATVFFAAWVLGGLISVFGALCFAEIGARLPAAGGFYRVFSYCYHPAYAFMLNWSMIITNSASAIGVAIVGAEYINPVFLPASLQGETGIRITAVSVVLVLAALNFAGIRTGARTQNFLSVLKIVLILACCTAIFTAAPADTATAATAQPEATGHWLPALGVCLIAVFFTFGGYQNTVNYGADVRDASRTIPRGIVTGIAIIMGLYLLLNYAYVQVIGLDRMGDTPLLASELAGAILGDRGFQAASVLIFISILGFINTSLISNPRIYYAMAEDGMLPPAFRKVNNRTMVQEFALGFFVTLMLVSLFLLGTFEKIVNYVMFIDSLALASAVAALFILRRRQPGFTGYRVRWFPVIPVVFIFVLLGVTVSVAWSDSSAALYGAVIFFAGYPLHLLFRRIFRS